MNCPHCETHIDEHEANRCLDAWVAEKVMEWEKLNFESHGSLWDEKGIYDSMIMAGFTHIYDGKSCALPHHSTSIVDAWPVHKKMCEKLFSVRRKYFSMLQEVVSKKNTEGILISYPDVFVLVEPEDFCLAALKASIND